MVRSSSFEDQVEAALRLFGSSRQPADDVLEVKVSNCLLQKDEVQRMVNQIRHQVIAGNDTSLNTFDPLQTLLPRAPQPRDVHVVALSLGYTQVPYHELSRLFATTYIPDHLKELELSMLWTRGIRRSASAGAGSTGLSQILEYCCNVEKLQFVGGGHDPGMQDLAFALPNLAANLKTLELPVCNLSDDTLALLVENLNCLYSLQTLSVHIRGGLTGLSMATVLRLLENLSEKSGTAFKIATKLCLCNCPLLFADARPTNVQSLLKSLGHGLWLEHCRLDNLGFVNQGFEDVVQHAVQGLNERHKRISWATRTLLQHKSYNMNNYSNLLSGSSFVLERVGDNPHGSSAIYHIVQTMVLRGDLLTRGPSVISVNGRRCTSRRRRRIMQKAIHFVKRKFSCT